MGRSAVACAAMLLLSFLPQSPAIGESVNGSLPQWTDKVWTDFPVEVRVDSREALEVLKARFPGRIDREDIRPDRSTVGEPGFRVRIRVTEEELRALGAQGYDPVRVRDDVRIGYEAAVETWKRQAALGGETARTGERTAYHTVDQIAQLLQDTEQAYPGIAQVFSIGTSVQGRNLIGIRITDNVQTEEAEPEVRITSTIHGDEPPGMEMLLYLVQYLTENYGSDPVVTNLVDNYDIYILPLHNPDGYVLDRRYNADWVDLNRNFPVPDGSAGEDGTYSQEPETSQLIANLGQNRNFVISINYHSGSLVVNYPWDYSPTRAPDEHAIIDLSLEYSTYNLPMYNGDWPQGITDGWDWYSVFGSLQDWSYHDTGCIDLTVEMSNNKWPSASQLPNLWNDNRESLLHWIQAARYGLNGVVTDAITGAPIAATVTIVGNPISVQTDPDHGDYYKLLDDGTYAVTVSADGYAPQMFYGISVAWGSATVLDVALVPESVAVDGEPLAAAGPRFAAWPNPMGERTTLSFVVPANGTTVDLAVFDAEGRRIRQLVRNRLDAGPISLTWDGRDLGGRRVESGVYFGRLSFDGKSESQRLTIVR